MCAGLAVLGVIWCLLALALNGLWATALMLGGCLALVAGGVVQGGLRERRRTAWIASGEAVRSLEVLEAGFTDLSQAIDDRIGRALAPIQRGASLPEPTFTGGLHTLARTAEEVANAVQRLGRGLAGTASPRRTQALLAELKAALAPLLAELANLQALRVRPEDAEGHRLLVATFTGVLRQIGDWASLGKERVRAACADLADGRSANVELPLALVPPPELQALLGWLQARGWWHDSASTPPTPSGASLSSSLLVGLVAGSMLGGHGHSGGSARGR